MLVTDCHCTVIEQNWKDIARIAWAGYLNDGRGVLRIDATRTDTVSPRPLMFYQPLTLGLAEDECLLAEAYDPTKEVVVCVVDCGGRHTCKASHLDSTPPAIYAQSERVPVFN
jgi:hypothetical protein